MSVNAFTAAVGAPGDSQLFAEGGAVSMVDLEYQRVRFAQREYVVEEDTPLRRVVILVSKDWSGWGQLWATVAGLGAVANVGRCATHRQGLSEACVRLMEVWVGDLGALPVTKGEL